ncbi:MAG: hypothetical protein ACFFCW_00125 [Candidatus Hodarchaeota archaeon]
MPGPPVTIGCNVILTPGAAGPPDSGVIVSILQTQVTASGMPLAVIGSICQMINSFTGVPYPLPIGPIASSGVKINGMSLVRMGDRIPSGPGVLLIAGPPAATNINDSWPP